ACYCPCTAHGRARFQGSDGAHRAPEIGDAGATRRPLKDKHAIAVAVEPIAPRHGLAVSAEDEVFPGKSRNEHQQRGFGEMKISEERVRNLEMETARDEQIDIAAAWHDFPRPRAGGVFERADSSGADRDHAASFAARAANGFGRRL